MSQSRTKMITIKTEHRSKGSTSVNQPMKNSPPSPLVYSSNSGVGSNSSHSEADFLSLGLSKVHDFYEGTEGMSSSHSSPAASPSFVQIDHDMFCSSTISLEENLSLLNGSSQKCNNSTSDSAGASCQRVCLVCGDVASGFHYGVASCEACKAFFKRTIQGNIEYTCPASGECEINKRRRKACQACRFTKCLAMGMLKEGVRLDRVRGGRQKYRKLSDSSFSSSVVPYKKQALDDNKLLEALQNCEPEGLQARQDLMNNSTMEPNLKVMTILSDVIDRELVGAICWAKQIPGFSRLSFNDQMRLLKTSWSEILALLLAYRSLQSSGNGHSQNSIVNLAFASNWTLDEQQAVDCGLEEIFVAIVQLMQRLDTLSLARDEYLALKALLLTNSDTQLENSTSVQGLRQHVLSTLYECVVASCPTSEVVNHYSELLLCLPLLRQLGTEIRSFWCQVRQEGKVSINKLFVEMLEPHFPPRPR